MLKENLQGMGVEERLAYKDSSLDLSNSKIISKTIMGSSL